MPIELNIHVASQSKIKSEAVRRAMQEIFPASTLNIQEHDVPSGVSSQPLGYEETAKGAANRLDATRKEIKEEKNIFIVSIENGVRYSEEEKKYYDFVHVMIEKDGVLRQVANDCCQVPNEWMDEIHRLQKNTTNFNTTWGKIAKEKGLAQLDNDPHKEECFGGVSRQEHIRIACIQALSRPAPLIQPKTMKNSARHQSVDLSDDGCSTRWPIFSTGDSSGIMKNYSGKVRFWGDVDPEDKVSRNEVRLNSYKGYSK